MNWRKLTLISILLTTLLLSSCVYFNYLYNAKKYYKDGTQNIVDYLQPDPKNVKRAELQKSIQRCTYILKEYPNSSYIGETIFLLGKAFYFNGEYFKAKRKFDEYLEFYATPETELEAQLFQTLTLYFTGQKPIAQEQMLQLAETVPQKEQAKFWYFTGIMQQQQKEYDDAAHYWKLIFQQYPRSSYAVLTANKIVQFSFHREMVPVYQTMGQWLLKTKLKKSEKLDLIPKLFPLLLENHDFALCQNMSHYYRKRMDDSMQPTIWAAEIAIEQNNYQEAESLLQSLPEEEAETTSNNISAQKYFLQAKIQGSYYSDFVYADSLLTLSQNSKANPQLNVKILNLRSIYQRFKEKNALFAQQDTLQEAQAQTALDLGQLYYFDLEEPQKARESFLHALELTQDSLRIAQIYYSLGWLTLETEQNQAVAENYFDQSVQTAPNSIYAQKIQQFRGEALPKQDVEKELREAEILQEERRFSDALAKLTSITESSVPDSVRFKAHLQIIRLQLHQQDTLAAGETFKKVLDNFPSSPYLPSTKKRYAFLEKFIIKPISEPENDREILSTDELAIGKFVESSNSHLRAATPDDELQIEVIIDAQGKAIEHTFVRGQKQIQPFQLKEIEKALYEARYEPASLDEGFAKQSKVLMTYRIISPEERQ